MQRALRIEQSEEMSMRSKSAELKTKICDTVNDWKRNVGRTPSLKELGDEVTEEDILEGICIEKSSNYKNYTTSATEKRKPAKREKKEDVDKNFITEVIAKALRENFEDVVIENMGKMIAFEYNGKPYTVDIKFARNKFKERQ